MTGRLSNPWRARLIISRCRTDLSMWSTDNKGSSSCRIVTP